VRFDEEGMSDEEDSELERLREDLEHHQDYILHLKRQLESTRREKESMLDALDVPVVRAPGYKNLDVHFPDLQMERDGLMSLDLPRINDEAANQRVAELATLREKVQSLNRDRAATALAMQNLQSQLVAARSSAGYPELTKEYVAKQALQTAINDQLKNANVAMMNSFQLTPGEKAAAKKAKNKRNSERRKAKNQAVKAAMANFNTSTNQSAPGSSQASAPTKVIAQSPQEIAEMIDALQRQLANMTAL
jgi:predicted  nucleic acid-binding Zn-ribbon protein